MRLIRTGVVGAALLLLASACQPAPVGRWAYVTPPPQALANPTTATVLDSGRVLVTSAGIPGAVFRYDPSSDRWLATAPMRGWHRDHVAVLLRDGRVLVVGGCSASELFSPTTVAWTSIARTPADCWEHTQGTRLADGRALVATARPFTVSVDSWQLQGDIYDPVANRWTSTPALRLPRMPPLDDDVFHYESEGWRLRSLTTSGSKTLAVVAAVLDEQYLDACDPDGYCSADEVGTRVLAAVYDASTGAWTNLGRPPGIGAGATSTLLTSGRILLTGGFQHESRFGRGISDAAVTWDPSTRQWAERPPMSDARNGHVAVRLADGRVLITGGDSYNGEPPELYVPTSSSATWAPAARPGRHRNDPHALLLKDGRVLVLGGGSDTAEVFTP